MGVSAIIVTALPATRAIWRRVSHRTNMADNGILSGWRGIIYLGGLGYLRLPVSLPLCRSSSPYAVVKAS